MQKIINVLAVASFTLSGAIAASGVYVYVNRDSIIDGIKSQVMGSLGGSSLGGALTGDVGITPDSNASQGASLGLPVPGSAF